MNNSSTLPEFGVHSGNSKRSALTEDVIARTHIRRVIAATLSKEAERLGRERSALKVLDYGCGRGALVGALRRSGYRAYGFEINPSYVEAGRILNNLFLEDAPVICGPRDGGRAPFGEHSFDVIITDQVVEHLIELGSVCSSISDLLAPGGIVIHIFPARFTPFEVHCRLPFVHWVKPGAVRRLLIRATLWLGFGGVYFPEYSLEQRAQIIDRYLREKVCYRSQSEIKKTFRTNGVVIDCDQLYQSKLESLKIPFARLLAIPASVLSRTFYQCLLVGRKVLDAD